jgi:hypothetical protein
MEGGRAEAMAVENVEWTEGGREGGREGGGEGGREGGPLPPRLCSSPVLLPSLATVPLGLPASDGESKRDSR